MEQVYCESLTTTTNTVLLLLSYNAAGCITYQKSTKYVIAMFKTSLQKENCVLG